MPEKQKLRKKWYRLDSSGYMYPMIKTHDTQSLFALSARFDEDVDAETLDRAVNSALTRYPFFKVKLKHGFFRYYFAENGNEFRSEEDSGRVLESIKFKKNNGYPFRVSHYKRTVRLEIFHALTDGRGAAEFFKTVIARYVELRYGETVEGENLKTVGSEPSSEEFEDAYKKFAGKGGILNAAKIAPEAAIPIKDVQLKHMGFGITTAVIDADKLKTVAKSYDCSVSEYLTAVILLAVSRRHAKKPSKKRLTAFIPVDLRQFFATPTLRNFVTFCLAKIDTKKTEPTVSAYVAAVKRELRSFLEDEQALSRKLAATTLMSTQPAIKFLPQTVKNAVVRSARAFGSSSQSIIVSNLGVVKLPESAAKHVEEFCFYLNCNGRSPKNAAAATFGNKCFLSFSRRTVHEDVEAETFSILEADGVPVEIYSNGRTENGRWAPDEERFRIPDKKGKRYLRYCDAAVAVSVILLFPLILTAAVLGGLAGFLMRIVGGKKVGFLDV